MNYGYGYAAPAANPYAMYPAMVPPRFQPAVQVQQQFSYQMPTNSTPTNYMGQPKPPVTNNLSNNSGTYSSNYRDGGSSAGSGNYNSNTPRPQASKPYANNFVPASSSTGNNSNSFNQQSYGGNSSRQTFSYAKSTNNYQSSSYHSSSAPSHNEKFEKAVINAAISVAQQKESGGAGGGGGGGNMGYRGGGGGGGGPRRSNYGSHKKPGGGDNKLYYCEVCKISCGGAQTYQTHIDGKQHKKKELQNQAGGSLVTAALKPGQKAFHCELCDITCTSQDAFNAHTSGAKHQKVAKLHEKLGKPVPTVTSAKQAQVKIVSASGVKFKSGGQLDTATGVVIKASGSASSGGAASATGFIANPDGDTDDEDEQVEIVGAEYIESLQTEDGKVVQYSCKLCECKFNDINAKDMHLKGRRHRLSYKKKVNPELKIDNRPNPRSKKAAEDRMRQLKSRHANQWKMDDVWAMKEEMRKMEEELYARFGGGMGNRKQAESFDDRHVLAKHQTIYPDEETLTAVQDIVIKTEKALKLVSDKLFEEDRAKAKEEEVLKSSSTENNTEATENKTDAEDDASKYRELKGVMRIGILAKGLMLKGDRTVSMAVLCKHWPTTILLSRMFKFLPDSLKESAESEDVQFDTQLQLEDGLIIVRSCSNPVITINVYLTSPICRTDDDSKDGEKKTGEEEKVSAAPANTQAALEERSKISKDKCLAILAELRHQKWFESRASGLASCVIIVRIIYDLINRVSSWNPLPKWAAELLVEKALSCNAESFMSPGDALRRVIEAMASGVLLPGGCGLMDPCEKEKADAAASLTAQQREDITASAQHALRLITFKNIHKVLGIQPLPELAPANRKRPAGPVSSVSDSAGPKVTKL